MKSFFNVCLALFLLLPIPPAFGQEVTKIETINIATPEWEGQTNKDGTGLFFDIIRSVYEPLRITMNFQLVPWKRAEQMVMAGKADALLDMYKEDMPESILSPMYPLVVEHSVAVLKKDRIKEWKGPVSLDGMHAVWIRGYDYHKSRHLKGLKLKWTEIDDYTNAWNMLDSRRVDVYLDAYLDVRNFIKANNIHAPGYRLEIIGSDKGYVVFSKSEKGEELARIYDKRIIELFESGELKKIFEKWNYPFSPDAWKEK